jgi:hypothetical protein
MFTDPSQTVAESYWDDQEHVKQYVDWFAKEMNVKRWSDWIKVKPDHLEQRGGMPLLKRYNKSIPKSNISILPDLIFFSIERRFSFLF